MENYPEIFKEAAEQGHENERASPAEPGLLNQPVDHSAEPQPAERGAAEVDLRARARRCHVRHRALDQVQREEDEWIALRRTRSSRKSRRSFVV